MGCAAGGSYATTHSDDASKIIVKFSQEKIGDFMLRFFLFIHSFFIDVLLPKTTIYDKIKLNKFLEFEEV